VSVVLAPGISGGRLGEALAEPQLLLDSPVARFVKDHRRTAVASAVVEGRELFVKRFKPYAWYRRLEWAAVGTPARRCWLRSAELEEARFRVAPRLAVAETRRLGVPGDCYFVTAAIGGAEPAGRFWRARGARAPLRERAAMLAVMAAELRRFHEAGFYSRDSNADNFLVRERNGTIEVYLLEVENVRRLRSVSERRRVKNLVQLYRPVRGEVRLLDRMRFLRAYRGTPLRRARGWLRDLAALDAKKEAEYQARRRRQGAGAAHPE
jgi:hypothetical protein